MRFSWLLVLLAGCSNPTIDNHARVMVSTHFDDAEYRQVKAGVAEWNAAPGLAVTVEMVPDSELRAYVRDETPNVVAVFTSQDCPIVAESGDIGICTRHRHGSYAVVCVDQWLPRTRVIAAHETGHALGILEHSPDVMSAMHADLRGTEHVLCADRQDAERSLGLDVEACQ